MTNLNDYIKPELLVLVPVLYILGLFIKQSESIKDKYIPSILGIVGIILSAMYVSTCETMSIACLFTSITQGILVAGVAVYTDQLVKQGTKDE